MRIGIDTHFISSGHATGNRTYTAGLVRALVTIDPYNEYVLYAIGEHLYYRQFDGNPRVRIRYVSSPKGLVRNFIALPQAIARDSLDVVHLHMLPPMVHVPCVLAVHDLYYLHILRPTLYEWLINRLVMQSVPRAGHVVTLSEYSKQDIAMHCRVDPEHITVIPLATDGRYHPVSDLSVVNALRQRLGIRQDYVLFVGRTGDPRKNVLTLVEAFAVLKANEGISEQLVITGRNDAGTQVIRQRVKELDLEHDVLLTSIVDDADMPTLLSGAKLVVYVSSFEGFGLPVLEAMACGTPVITSNTTSLPEVAGDAALTITPGRVDELAQAMLTVLQNTALQQQLRERGLQRAKLFSWEWTARKTLQVYQVVAAQKRNQKRGIKT